MAAYGKVHRSMCRFFFMDESTCIIASSVWGPRCMSMCSLSQIKTVQYFNDNII
jgi:hypothetical protein